jgi:hypothetical protein
MATCSLSLVSPPQDAGRDILWCKPQVTQITTEAHLFVFFNSRSLCALRRQQNNETSVQNTDVQVTATTQRDWTGFSLLDSYKKQRSKALVHWWQGLDLHSEDIWFESRYSYRISCLKSLWFASISPYKLHISPVFTIFVHLFSLASFPNSLCYFPFYLLRFFIHFPFSLLLALIYVYLFSSSSFLIFDFSFLSVFFLHVYVLPLAYFVWPWKSRAPHVNLAHRV